MTSFEEKIAHHISAVKRLLWIEKPIQQVVDAIWLSYRNGGKVLICGNGGSAADAQHFAAELVGTFGKCNRKAFPVISLATDTSVLTALANDLSYSLVFGRQVEALCTSKDVLICISTSGESANILNVVEAALRIGATTIGLTGGYGELPNSLAKTCDIPLVVPSTDTPTVQELHEFVLHYIAECVDQLLLEENEVQADAKRQS